MKRAVIDVQKLKSKIEEVGEEAGIKLQTQVSLEDGKPRSAVNRPWIPDIILSTTFWLAEESDTIRKIGLLVHEYLGLMGVEKTDQFLISSDVMSELREMANANFLFERQKLFPPPISKIGPCANITGLWRLKEQVLQITQSNCEALTIVQGRVVSDAGRMIFYRENGISSSTYFLKKYELDDSGWESDSDIYSRKTKTRQLKSFGNRLSTFYRDNFATGKSLMEVESHYVLKDSETLLVKAKTSLPSLNRSGESVRQYRRIR